MSMPRAAISLVLAVSMIAGTALMVAAQDDETDPGPIGSSPSAIPA